MKKAAWLIVLLSQVAVIIAFWLSYHLHHIMGNQLTGDLAGQLLAWGRLAGLLAAFGILTQIVLIGRVKWVERVFGLDRLTRLHHIIGFALIGALLAHPCLVTAGHARQSDTTQWAQFLDFCRSWPGVFAAAVAFAIMAFAMVISVLIVIKRLRMRYEVWYATHLTFYIAIALAFSHQLNVGSDLIASRWFALYWKLLYVFAFGNLLLYRFIRPVWFFVRHRFKVARLVQEVSDVTSVYIEGRNLDKFPVEAGQFMIVRFLAPGYRWEAHPFSMSCMPDGKQIRLTIKQLGDFTRRVPQIKPGTPVLIDGPHGVFTARNCPAQKILMIAGGIGITPIRSLAQELLAAGRDIVLIYGNRNHTSIAFEKELADLSASAQGRLRIVHVMSDDPSWPGEKGRVDRALITKYAPDLTEREVLLCGPPIMMKSVRATLAEMKVPSSRIHYERFAL
jgi:predicted ferric reductase